MDEQRWGVAARGGDSAALQDAPPPKGTVPQAASRVGTASHLAMQNAAEWLDRDKSLGTVEKGRHAAVDTGQFRNDGIGKGWKASYVQRQKGVGGDRDQETVVDLSSREGVQREKEAAKLRRQKKRGWLEDYEKSIMPHARAPGSDSSSDSDDPSQVRRHKKKHKKESKGKKHKKEKKRRKKEKTSKEADRDVQRERLIAYINLVPDLSEEELRQACESEGMDAPPAGTSLLSIQRVMQNHFAAKLRDYMAGIATAKQQETARAAADQGS